MAKQKKKKTIEFKELRIISDDIQNRDNIAFGFDAYANALVEIIATKANKTPYTIGISGKWGSGKTTLMKEIEKRFSTTNKIDEAENLNAVQKNPIPDNDHFRRIKTVWFNAWKYKDEEQILAALINEIINKFENDNNFLEGTKKNVKEEILKPWKRFDWFNAVKELTKVAGKAAFNIDLDKFIQIKDKEKEYKDYKSYYDTFNKHFDKLLWEFLEVESWEVRLKSLKENPQANVIPPDQEAALVIFIDDLDRCPLPKIIKILETIKMFLDKKGCIFVLGAAKDIIREALNAMPEYKSVKGNADKFLEKIIQIDFNLPRKTDENFQVFIDEIIKQLNIPDKDKIKTVIKIILPVLDFNPRRIIALFNKIKLQEAILRHSGNEVTFEKMILWYTLEKYNNKFFNWLIYEENNYFIAKDDINLVKKQKNKIDLQKEILVNKHAVYYNDVKIQQLFKYLDLSKKELYILRTHSNTFKEYRFKNLEEYKNYIIDKERQIEREHINYNEFIKIEKGVYDLGNYYNLNEVNKVNINQFYISKYPVTNIWFKEFIAEDGYIRKEYWKGNNAKTFLKNLTIKKPRFFNNEKFNKNYQPVVGVSWYEINAFLAWLSNKDKRNIYRLPNEKEWILAAMGKVKKVYPWGNYWDETKCNNESLELNRTSIVGIFNNGVSDFGLHDMAGNVSEIVSSFVRKESPKTYGGSWVPEDPIAEYAPPYDVCRISDFDSVNMETRASSVGFRVIKEKKSQNK